jgi:hypothetical protein
VAKQNGSHCFYICIAVKVCGVGKKIAALYFFTKANYFFFKPEIAVTIFIGFVCADQKSIGIKM